MFDNLIHSLSIIALYSDKEFTRETAAQARDVLRQISEQCKNCPNLNTEKKQRGRH